MITFLSLKFFNFLFMELLIGCKTLLLEMGVGVRWVEVRAQWGIATSVHLRTMGEGMKCLPFWCVCTNRVTPCRDMFMKFTLFLLLLRYFSMEVDSFQPTVHLGESLCYKVKLNVFCSFHIKDSNFPSFFALSIPFPDLFPRYFFP